MTEQIKKQLFQDTAKYISSQYIAQFFGIVISFAMKRFLGPNMTGVWNVVLLVVSYCSFANLGVVEVAYRDIPFFKGSQQPEKAERLKNEAYTFALLTTIVPAIGIFVYAFLFKVRLGSSYLFAALLFTAFLLVAQKVYDYYTMLLRANKEFTVISQVTVVAAFSNLLLTFLLVWPFKLYGLFVAAFLNVLIPFYFVHRRARYQLRLAISRSGLLQMLKIGFPIFVLGLCSQMVSSVDRIIVAKYLDMTALGNYSIAMMAGNYLLGMPNMFCITLYPRLQEKYGEDRSPEHIKNYLLKPIQIVAILIGFLIGLSILVMPFLVARFLPAFVSGIPAMKIFVWSVFFFAIGQHAYTFLITLNKQLRAIPIAVLGILSIAGLDMLFIRMGLGIEGAAWGVLLGSILYNCSLIAYAKSHFASRRESLMFFGFLFAMFSCFTVLVFLVEKIGSDGSLVSVLFRVLTYLILIAPVFWVLEKKTGFVSLAFSVIREKLAGVLPVAKL